MKLDCFFFFNAQNYDRQSFICGKYRKQKFDLFQGGIAIAVIIGALLIPVKASSEVGDKFQDTTSAQKLLVQNGLTKVTGVKLQQTPSGLRVVLKTEGNKQLVPLILPEGKQLTIELLDATLALSQGNSWQQANPTPGIEAINLTQIDSTSIRLTITGEEQTPTADVVPSAKDLIISVSPEGTQEADTPEIIDVVVTAQKTEESLQEVPLSVTALTEKQLEDGNIDSLRGISDSTPNFSILDASDSRYFLYYSLRGFSNSNLTNRDAVGFYIDDVPYDYGGFLDQNLIDLERVEVLRGAQNILYGRSAIAGVVNTITR